MITPSRRPSIPTRLLDGRICAYDLSPDLRGVLAPTAEFRPLPDDEVKSHTVFADLQRAVYTTLNSVVCAAADGTELWRSDLRPLSDRLHGHWPGCALSLDEREVWVYRPDAMAGRNGPDRWVVLDARTGATVAGVDLETVGHGGQQYRNASDGHILLDVGEGQDGSVIYRAALDGAEVRLTRYPWPDRCLIDLAPDGRQFMTVDHGQADVAFHNYPAGDTTLVLTADAFGHEAEDAYIEWSGGYLTPDSALITIACEIDPEDDEDLDDDEREGHRHYHLDLLTREITEFPVTSHNSYDLTPLGDGTWLTSAPSGHPVRWPAH
ncbi:hypothetical protein ABT040_16865 [Streptomyces sp. NPDC002688]|uniref:hypothetical protein n=1 Tax=Streptomyces sp. NPDC002688 TaxID=3154423 RepID=UPI0033204ED8